MEDTTIRAVPESPVLKVTTETGSVYHICPETGYWDKNGRDFHRTLTFIKVGAWEDRLRVNDWPEVDIPEVGKSMFIQGRGMSEWYITTPVVSVERIN